MTEKANEHRNGARLPALVPMSSDGDIGNRDDPDDAGPIILRAADAFDGRHHVMSEAACKLHVWGTADSAARNQPGFVPDEYVSRLTGEDLNIPGAQPAILAAELCTAGIWQRANGGYRVLDWQVVQMCVDHVRELREKDKRAPTREARTRADKMSQELRRREADKVPGQGTTRLGERIGQAAAASFRCAACGEMAGVVKVARAGTTIDMGPPLGRETYDRDAIVVDYFLGTASKFADAATLDAVQEVVASATPDPVALRRIDWELTPFYCPDCDLNYCRADWETFPIFDEGFYDYTIGICPSGHRHTVDD
jgi:hypothetical protein